MRGNLGPGKVVSKIEAEINKIHNVKNTVCTTSGTMAILIAIKALNLSQNSTIIFPNYTFLAGANAARFLGYNIELVDISEDTLCINPFELDRAINKSPKNISCVIFVNHNGYSGSDICEIRKVCDRHKIPMIEDSAQCLGINNTGNTGDIGILSFSVPKAGCSGQGGAILTNNDSLAQRCRNLIDHGGDWRKDRSHQDIGVNLRFNDISASYLLLQLRDIENILQKRWWICNEYDKHIPIQGFRPGVYSKTTPWMVVYKSKCAEQIIDNLKHDDIQAVQYYRAISDNMPYTTDMEYPIAQRMAKELIYLPSSLNLTKAQIKRICKIIINTERKNR